MLKLLSTVIGVHLCGYTTPVCNQAN